MKFPALVLLIAFTAIAQFPDTFLGSVSVGQNPMDVCLSPDGGRAYVAVGFGFATVVDINGYSDFSLAGLVTIDGEPVTLQCDPTGDYLYVADQENNLVHVVNTSEFSVVKTLEIQPDPTDMVLCSTGDRIYLSHENGMVTVIDTDSQTIEDSFWVGEEINSICITPAQDLVFAADDGSPEEAVITTSTGILTHINSGMDSYGCAVSGDGARLFLSCLSWNIIGVMDIASLAVEGTISCTGDGPDKLAALPALPYLYGVCPDQNVITVFGTDDLTEKGEISLTGGPANIAVHPDGERLFVVCSGDNKVKVIGFDPAGIDPAGSLPILSILDSPSSAPSVCVSSPNGGSLYLRAFDLAGRTVWMEKTLMSPGETKQFIIGNAPQGVLTVTATNGGAASSIRVVVL